MGWEEVLVLMTQSYHLLCVCERERESVSPASPVITQRELHQTKPSEKRISFKIHLKKKHYVNDGPGGVHTAKTVELVVRFLSSAYWVPGYFRLFPAYFGW